MANIEYFANEVKTEQDAVQDRTATSAKIQPASCVRAGHGIRCIWEEALGSNCLLHRKKTAIG
jgi:hypothetical protein